MDQVNVGDEVGYGRYHWGTLLQHGFSRVTKINRWGHITLENGKVFNKDGYERGREHGALRIMDADRLRAELAANARQRERNETLRQLRALLDSHVNGFGNICEVSSEARLRMIDLVSEL